MPETAARRARARRNPAIFKPPLRPVARRDPVEGLRLHARGRAYPIGANVEGDTPWELSIEGAGTVTLPVRSPDDSLLAVLAEERLIQQEGVRTTIDDVIYVISAID